MPFITNHARTRMKSRAGMTGKMSQKMARRALERGIRYEDTVGTLREYCKTLRVKKNGRRTDVRIHAGYVFIFDRIALLTMYPIPQEYRAEAEALQAKLRLERNGGVVDGTVDKTKCDSVPAARDAGWQSPVQIVPCVD